MISFFEKIIKIVTFSLAILFLGSCNPKAEIRFSVINPLPMNRTAETVSLPVSQLNSLVSEFGIENILIKDLATDSFLVTQAVDMDSDGTPDEILFQAIIPADGQKEYAVEGLKNGASLQPKSKLMTFSRFVPERIDDYAWENDRVAFRAYGPTAQKNTELGLPDSTLSSGIDCWLKRVTYPVIDKWYKMNSEQKGYYHIDHGEGYDPYHVGPSRGCGGIGIWDNNRFYVSKNYTGYKTIATGPIRTIFELTYAPWGANGRTIKETKRITLDLGSNLTRYEEFLQSGQPVQCCTIGITLHEDKGNVEINKARAWFSYWEPIDSSELGTGIVIDPKSVKEARIYRVDEPSMSHLFVTANLTNDKLVYYAGFGWKKSGQFDSQEDWDAYLNDFAKRMASPLEVKF